VGWFRFLCHKFLGICDINSVANKKVDL